MLEKWQSEIEAAIYEKSVVAEMEYVFVGYNIYNMPVYRVQFKEAT